MIYYLRRQLNATVIAGDWNCVLSNRDSTSSNCHISKSLNNTVRTLRLKDAWFIKNKTIEYTYIRHKCKSRLDRIYLSDLAETVSDIQVIHTSISDHSCVKVTLGIKGIPLQGKYYWKMNTSLLKDTDVKQRFKDVWHTLKTK